MKPQSGTISSWNDDQGFGFIHSAAGQKTFFHINEYSRRHRRPQSGLAVTYRISTDPAGRPCAVQVIPQQGHRLAPNTLSRKRLFAVVVLAGFALLLHGLYERQLIPLEIIGLYALMSLLTYRLYAKDKRAAHRGEWRTPESRLHLYSACGGWPGAAIAQSFLRHKSRKTRFRGLYWVTVAINAAALYWITTPEGARRLNDGTIALKALIAGILQAS